MNPEHLLNKHNMCMEYVPCKIEKEQMKIFLFTYGAYSKICAYNKILMKMWSKFSKKNFLSTLQSLRVWVLNKPAHSV